MQLHKLPHSLQEQLANSKQELARQGFKPSSENVALIDGVGTPYQAIHAASGQEIIFTDIHAIPATPEQIMEAPLLPNGTIRIIAPIGSLYNIRPV